MTGRIPGADRGPHSVAAAAVLAADPLTEPHRLEELATDLPSTRPIVAANPSAPDYVLRFLATFHDPGIDAALAANPSALRAGAISPTEDDEPRWADAPTASRFDAIVLGPGAFGSDALGGIEPGEGAFVDESPTGELPIIDDSFRGSSGDASGDGSSEGGANWPPPLLGAASDEDPETAAEPTPITAFLGGSGTAAAAARRRQSGLPRSAALVLLPILVVAGVFAVVALATSSLSFGKSTPRRLGTTRTVPTLPAPPPQTVPFGPSGLGGASSTQPVTTVDATTSPTTSVEATTAVDASSASIALPEPTGAPDVATANAATTLRPAVLPATVKPTTTAAKPVTASQPGLSIDLADPSVQQAGSIAQQLLNAFATGDWSTARRLQPGDVTSNAQYDKTYADLHDGTVVLARAVSTGGGGYSVRLGIVAHQGFSGPKTTVLSCAHWNIDIGSSGVQRVSIVTVRTASGTIDADSVAAELRSSCANAALA